MKYKKKPVVIEAFKWTGDETQLEDPQWIVDAIKNGTVYFKGQGTPEVALIIKTLEGDMVASRGNYIIKGIKGELYPVRQDIFEETYEAVVEAPCALHDEEEDDDCYVLVQWPESQEYMEEWWFQDTAILVDPEIAGSSAYMIPKKYI